ncbi:MAG: squalene/phytoene synthase family protein [Anaerolineaceae bacterium]|nr:squalene/phytoene synthase family protein [Anaerolineaceae bacterium]
MPIDHWDLLKKTSRTFFISIKQLPGLLAESMCLSYLLLRVSDYLEDNLYMSSEEKIETLVLWESILAQKERPEKLYKHLDREEVALEADGYLSQQAGELLKLVGALPEKFQQASLPHVRATTLGMARWIAQGPAIQSEEEMDDYMYEVAGRVGFLSTELFAAYSPSIQKRLSSLLPLATDSGLALQTVNILRGLRKDYERGWIYIPESYCQEAGIKQEDLFDPQQTPAAMQVINRVADKAEQHLTKAMSYVLVMPPWLHNIRLACVWPMLFAAQTLAMSRHNVNILTSEVKIPREYVVKIIRKTSLLGWDNIWLMNYYNQLISHS